MKFFVYILYSETLKKYYCGQTNDLLSRLSRHNRGLSKWTNRGIPWEIVHSLEIDSRSEAMAIEKKIKSRGIKRYLEDENLL